MAHPLQICLYPAILLNILHSSDARIIGSYILPHGGIALAPSSFESQSKWAKQWAWAVHRYAVEVGSHIRSLNPDLIFLSTPHGVADLSKFMFYLNGRANGSALTDHCGCPPCCYDVDVTVDADLSADLVGNLSAHGCNVSGLSFFGPPGGEDQEAVLKWGEVIPLLFVKDLSKSKIVVLSHPSRRYQRQDEMISELLDLGSKLFVELDKLRQSVVVIISADLAHTHDPQGPYGFSPAAEPFDNNVGNWAATLHPSYLLTEAARYAPEAKSCGFTGMVMLHGLLNEGHLSSWLPVMHANYHPSYYGMMVASFSRRQSPEYHCPNCGPS